jgi:hypothetical protein
MPFSLHCARHCCRLVLNDVPPNPATTPGFSFSSPVTENVSYQSYRININPIRYVSRGTFQVLDAVLLGVSGRSPDVRP